MLEQPWINLEISVKGKQMQMKLLNGKVNMPQAKKPQDGIGLKNVQKRLSLLYPGKYELTITNEEEVFIINLKLELEQKKEETRKEPQTVEMLHA
jgi:LytS/YehU family sensor histidine kinase